VRYMLIRKADADTENAVLPTEEVLQAMADYNERMMQAGVFVSGDGIRPTREGCRIRFRNGEPSVVHGPFEPAAEQLAGYSILEVDSLEEAIAWAREWPREDVDATLELRRYFTLEDFEPSAALDQHRSQERLPREMNVHVCFAGNCREAMRFYADVTGGHLEALLTVGETPAAEEFPPERQDDIIHASLNLRGRRLMGADMSGDCYQQPRGSQVHLEYESPEEAERVFTALARGGEVIMPFEQTFWAHRFGMTRDRYGIQWMISCQLQQCL